MLTSLVLCLNSQVCLNGLIMPEVFIPTRMQSITGGQKSVHVAGGSVRQIINNLENEYPGIRERLCDENGIDLLPGIAVIIDGETSQLGLLERVEENSEVHFLPALGGG